jgi:hypothetical protein
MYVYVEFIEAELAVAETHNPRCLPVLSSPSRSRQPLLFFLQLRVRLLATVGKGG